MSERDCNNCDCEMYCTRDSCINDMDESEEFFRNQDIVEGLE